MMEDGEGEDVTEQGVRGGKLDMAVPYSEPNGKVSFADGDHDVDGERGEY